MLRFRGLPGYQALLSTNNRAAWLIKRFRVSRELEKRPGAEHTWLPDNFYHPRSHSSDKGLFQCTAVAEWL